MENRIGKCWKAPQFSRISIARNENKTTKMDNKWKMKEFEEKLKQLFQLKYFPCLIILLFSIVVVNKSTN